MNNFKNIEIGKSKFNISSKGAMMTGWKYKGEDIIPELHQKENSTSLRGGAPICFPFFNASPPGMENIPQHGWLRNEELSGEIISQSEDEVVIRFSKVNAPIENYPWQLKYTITHRLTGQSAESILKIERLNDDEEKDAPINPAFHAYFTINPNGKTKIGEHTPKFTSDFYYTNIPLVKDTELSKKGELIVDTRVGKIKMETEGLKVACLWTDDLERYACIEPTIQEHLKFNTPEGKFLKQEEKIKLSMKVSIAE